MIIAVFDECSRRVDIDGKLTQWDYGQVLQICGMEVEEEQIQVHFTDKCTNGALVVLGKVEDGDITVDIPNELLKRSGTIQAYVYKTIPGEGKTIFEIRLSVKARKKPEDYEAPADKHALEQIVERLKQKGDGLQLEGNQLQLLSGKDTISSVNLSNSGGTVEIESITNSEIDEIMKGAVIAAEKKYLDQDGLAHLVQKNDERYVKKEVGKGLSSNDFSDEYKKKIDDLAYTKIAINSLTATNSSNEIGATVTASDIAWALNKEPKTQKIQFASEAAENLDKSIRKKSYTGKTVKANTNIVLTVTDERDASVSRTVTIAFQPKVYWGKTNKASLANADILALEGSALAGGRGRSFTVNAGAGEKIVYAIPTSFGTPTFNVGGFDGGFTKAQTLEFTNASGYKQSYDVWMSVNAGLGSTAVTVK